MSWVKEHFGEINTVSFLLITLLLFGSILISWFVPSQDTVRLEVVGVVNDTNTTGLVYLHFECIKECNKRFANVDRKLSGCWSQCEKLGK